MSEINYRRVRKGWEPQDPPPGGDPAWKTCPIPADQLIVIPGRDGRSLEVLEIGNSVHVRWTGSRWVSAHLHDDVVLKPRAFGTLVGSAVDVHVEWTTEGIACRLPALEAAMTDRLVEWTWSWTEADGDHSLILARNAGERCWRLGDGFEPADFPAAVRVAKRGGTVRLELRPQWRAPSVSWWLGLDVPVPLPRVPDREEMDAEVILRFAEDGRGRCVPPQSRVLSGIGDSYALRAIRSGDEYVLLRGASSTPLRISDLVGATELVVDSQLPSHWSGRERIRLPKIDWTRIVGRKIRYSAMVDRRKITFPEISAGAQVTFGPERTLVHGTSKVYPVQLAPPHNISAVEWLRKGMLPNKRDEWKELHEASGGYLLVSASDSQEYGVLVSAIAAPKGQGAWEPLCSSSRGAFDLISWHGLIDRAQWVEYSIEDREGKRSLAAIRFENGFLLDDQFTAAAPFGQVAMVFGDMSWRGLDPESATLRLLDDGSASVDSTFLWLNESGVVLSEQVKGCRLDLDPAQEVVLILTGQIRAGTHALPMLAWSRGRLPRLIGILDPHNLVGSTDDASGAEGTLVGRGAWTVEKDIGNGRRKLEDELMLAWTQATGSNADAGNAGGVSWIRRVTRLGGPSEIRFGEVADLPCGGVFVWRQKVAEPEVLSEPGHVEAASLSAGTPIRNRNSESPHEAP